MVRVVLAAGSVVGVCWGVGVAAAARPVVTTLASGLRAPAALAVWPPGDGRAPLALVGEQTTGRIVAVTIDTPGDPVEMTRLDRPAGAQAFRLALLGEAFLIATRAGADGVGQVEVFPLSNNRGRRPATPSQRLKLRDAAAMAADGPRLPIATGARHYYWLTAANGGLRVHRGRHARGTIARATQLSIASGVAPAGVAVGLAVRRVGAVVLALSDGGRSRLVFCQVEQGTFAPPVAIDVPLAGLRGIAYSVAPRPEVRDLYAIADSGLHRIDAAVDDRGRLGCVAPLVAELEDPLALACAPGGSVLVTLAGDAADAGVLVRVDLP